MVDAAQLVDFHTETQVLDFVISDKSDHVIAPLIAIFIERRRKFATVLVEGACLDEDQVVPKVGHHRRGGSRGLPS